MTESDEYVALESELADQATELEAVQSELESALSDTADVEALLGTSEDTLEEVQATLTETEVRAAEAEAALAEFLDQPWPDGLKDDFVVGCASEVEEGLTPEQQVAVCQCTVDKLEEEITFIDFMLFSLSAIDPEIELNPVTSLPYGLDEEFLGVIVQASTSCFLSLEP